MPISFSDLKNLNTQRLMIVVLFALLFALAVRIPLDTDTWWHLRSGQYILDHRAVPLTDPFSLTRRNQPWIDHSWGSQLILLGFYTVGGMAGLAIYTALLATAGMVFVYLMCEGNVYLRAFVVIVAAATAAVFWSPRPQMMSFFLSAVVLYVLHLYKRRKVDQLWLIPALMVLWVNAHGGFAIGFILLFGTIAGEVLGRLFDSNNPDVLAWRQIRRLAAITIIAGLVLAINPNTIQMWGYPFRTVGIGVLQNFIQEWASPNFHGRETWPFIFLLLGTFAAVGLARKRLDWTDLTLTAGTAFLSLYAGRNISTFALVAAPVLSRHANAWLEERGLRLARPRPARGFALVLNWAILALVILGVWLKIAATLNPKLVAEAQADSLPVRAAAYLNEHQPAGPMFNSYNWGGYLMFAAPEYPVFVDGRTDLYDDELLTQWLKTMSGGEWRKTFDEWQINLAVIEWDSALAKLLRQDADWKEVYQDGQASIFERQRVVVLDSAHRPALKQRAEITKPAEAGWRPWGQGFNRPDEEFAVTGDML